MWPFTQPSQTPGSPGDSIDLDVSIEAAECPPAVRYVNLLIMKMAENPATTLTLSADQKLRDIEDVSPPAFSLIVNRLKIMSGLDPILYPRPQDGLIELSTRTTCDDRMVPVHIHARFTDHPYQTVELTLSRDEQ